MSRLQENTIELLSPAGNYSAFLAAINAGCDAVYLGGTKFGARAFADNFSDDEIVQAIHYAHLFDVKVYLTVNTLVKEKEFSDVLSYVRLFADAGLDGFIVQDIGLMKALRETYPSVQLHVSTQANVTGIEGAKFFKELGASRVVLARELDLSEIREIKDHVDIELETFVHGAMCYCYSGQCLFSSSLGGRSGNRGRCAGPCRLPYTYNGKEQFLLSMKDQCTLEILPKILESGTNSLKIEGRMKKAEYVAFVTSMYRKYIDLYYKDKEHFHVDPKDIDMLRHMYMREEIGTGYYETRNSKSMIALYSSGYAGSDDALMKQVKETYIDTNKKVSVTGFVSALLGHPLSFSLTCKDQTVFVEGNLVEKSKTNSLSLEDIKKSFSKFGDTFFEMEDITIEMDDNIFIPVSSMNQLRRDAIKRLVSIYEL